MGSNRPASCFPYTRFLLLSWQSSPFCKLCFQNLSPSFSRISSHITNVCRLLPFLSPQYLFLSHSCRTKQHELACNRNFQNIIITILPSLFWLPLLTTTPCFSVFSLRNKLFSWGIETVNKKSPTGGTFASFLAITTVKINPCTEHSKCLLMSIF